MSFAKAQGEPGMDRPAISKDATFTFFCMFYISNWSGLTGISPAASHLPTGVLQHVFRGQMSAVDEVVVRKCIKNQFEF
jgi:hypothetical protein